MTEEKLKWPIYIILLVDAISLLQKFFMCPAQICFAWSRTCSIMVDIVACALAIMFLEMNTVGYIVHSSYIL